MPWRAPGSLSRWAARGPGGREIVGRVKAGWFFLGAQLERGSGDNSPAAKPSCLAPLDAGVASGSILIGDEGKDEYGYPRKYVDRALVRSLLLHRRFGELTAHVEHLQSAFEQDYRREYWVYDAADALGTGEVGRTGSSWLAEPAFSWRWRIRRRRFQT